MKNYTIISDAVTALKNAEQELVGKYVNLELCEEIRKVFYGVMDEYEGWFRSRRLLIEHCGVTDPENVLKNYESKMLLPETKASSEDMAAALEEVIGLLNNHVIYNMVVFGTALGLVREGKPISYDTGVDIAIHRTHLSDFLSSVMPRMLDYGYWLVDTYNESLLKFAKYEGDRIVTVYIYAFEAGDERMVCEGYSISFEQWNNPLFSKISGVNYRLPGNPHQYLVEKYGEDYMTPISGKHAIL